jgi:hypothetical protein
LAWDRAFLECAHVAIMMNGKSSDGFWVCTTGDFRDVPAFIRELGDQKWIQKACRYVEMKANWEMKTGR